MARTSNKTKPAPEQTAMTAPSAPTTTAVTAPAPNAPVEHRENPRINEKIDEWIRRNPDQFKFFNEMPHERAVRKLILNEIEKYERQQKARSYRQQEQTGDENAPRHERNRSNGNGMRAR